MNPHFPPPENALSEPEGLLAIGGNLKPQTLLDAYQQGIFPWYEQQQPILWWSPAERAVLKPANEYCSKSMAKVFRRKKFQFTSDRAFKKVVDACAGSRKGATGTWITPQMREAYCVLHTLGHAHSVECWHQGRLVGGLYGLQIGGIFCGESMFSLESNASKAAFILLSQVLASQGFSLIDCQLPNPHLASLGVSIIPRADFLKIIQQHGDKAIRWPDEKKIIASSAMLESGVFQH